MKSRDEVAKELLNRLLAGERGNLPMHLAMLLEKSSPLRNTDDHYRQILPPELADVRLDPEMVQEINHALCNEIRRNPDLALISASAFTGSAEVTRTAVDILLDPPRPLTVPESGQVLTIVGIFLPRCLDRDPQFISASQRARLIELLRNLPDAAEISVMRHTSALLKRLTAGS
jgi:hypothetical protein